MRKTHRVFFYALHRKALQCYPVHMRENFFLYNFDLHQKYAWTEELEYNLQSSFVEFRVITDNMRYNTALVALDGSKMEITNDFLKYFKYNYNPHRRGAYDMRPLLNQLNGNLVYKGKKFGIIRTERWPGQLSLNIETNKATYVGCIKPNGIRMELKADFTCENEIWTLGDFERDPN